VTTRTPTASVVAGGQTLPRTGTDLTTFLTVVGGALLLAGAAIEVASRSRPALRGEGPSA
jgi:LPXTG-motif cell wall-anchored protein